MQRRDARCIVTQLLRLSWDLALDRSVVSREISRVRYVVNCRHRSVFANKRCFQSSHSGGALKIRGIV